MYSRLSVMMFCRMTKTGHNQPVCRFVPHDQESVGIGATALDSSGDVAIGGMDGFQGRTARKINALEAEHAPLSLDCCVDAATAAFDTGGAKLLHFTSSFVGG